MRADRRSRCGLLLALVMGGLDKLPTPTGAISRRQRLAARRVRLLACPSAARPDLLIDARTRRWSAGGQWRCLSHLCTYLTSKG
jgi:hypothetical protein